MYFSKDREKELQKGLQTAFIHAGDASNLAYRPEFVFNDYKQGRKVLASMEQELLHCDAFCISVAFITKSGITPLLQTLKELEKKNIPGKILTTDYLMFSEPKALDTLASLKNVEVKMFCTDAETGGFHTKGYIFQKEEMYRIIIGSSNMTLSAITKNKEWNTKIVSMKEGEIAQEIVKEFQHLWDAPQAQPYEQFIEEYRTKYKIVKAQKAQAKKEKIVSLQQYELKPNKMQVQFINQVEKMYRSGKEKALLISSTGTGKTYASAFALRELNPKKALFLVHREARPSILTRSVRKEFFNRSIK